MTRFHAMQRYDEQSTVLRPHCIVSWYQTAVHITHEYYARNIRRSCCYIGLSTSLFVYKTQNQQRSECSCPRAPHDCISAIGLAWIVTFFNTMSVVGRSAPSTGTFSIFSRASTPPITCPKIEYLPSRDGCAAYVIKNWLPARTLAGVYSLQTLAVPSRNHC